MHTGLVDFYRHNQWANLRLLDACAQLSDEQLTASARGTYGRISDLLVHVLRAEDGYLARVTGRQPEDRLTVGTFPGIETLRAHARRSGEGLLAVAAVADPAQVVRGIYRGEPDDLPLMVPLMQAINHATDHRSQIATVPSQIGVEPPELDVWAYDAATRD
jgi:uncharacterized damage-inducible protein DinB